ncbi:MAG TPA: Uma2 family endonuclease [Anditalea sp.]|nr:Uma2 family endonuclease [Anditalea sp.]
MKAEETENQMEEPYTSYGSYSYADYLTWEIDGMVELIKGKVFRQAAAPKMKHQEISIRISSKFFNYLEKKTCKVFAAPFDVRLPLHSNKNEDIFTVVQPDICVVCDPEKLDEAGCIGAPDLVVEILSPGNNKKELQNKYEVYEESGVKEYWVIHPEEQTLMIYTLKDGKFIPSKLFTSGEMVASSCIEGFQIDLDEVFVDLD